MPSWFTITGRRRKPRVTPTVDVPDEPPDHIHGAGTKHQQLWARLLVNSRTDLGLRVPAWLLRLSRGADVRGSDEPTGNPGNRQVAAAEPLRTDSLNIWHVASLERGPADEQTGAQVAAEELAGPSPRPRQTRGGGFAVVADWDAILEWTVGQDIVRDDSPFNTPQIRSRLQALLSVIEILKADRRATLGPRLELAAQRVALLLGRPDWGLDRAETIESGLNAVRDAIREIEDAGARSHLTSSYLEVLVAAGYRSREPTGFSEARARLARSHTPDLDLISPAVREHPGPPPVPRGMSAGSRPPTRAPNAPATQQGQ